MSVDIHALSGAYAVDALDDQEREAFERHLADCGTCRAEVDGLREAAASLADTVPVTPPAHLRQAVLDNIAKVRPLPPVVPISRRRAPRRVWMSGSLIAAAAIALFVVVMQPHTTSGGLTAAADRVVHASDAVSVSQHLANGATVVWYRSAALDAAAISIKNLPTAATGKTYELWLQASNGVMRPAGLVGGGTRLLTLNGAARSAVGAGMTIEPAGGSASPTLPAVTLASFPIT